MESTLNEINLKLTQVFGDQVDKLKSMMEGHEVFISGSAIIECVLGENWTHQTPSEKGEVIQGPIFEFFCNDRENTKQFIEFVKKFTEIKRSVFRRGNIRSPWTYRISQTIVYENVPHPVRHEDMVEHIDKLFHFDICKNFYRICDGKEELYIGSFDAILNKKSTFFFLEKPNDQNHYLSVLIDCMYYKNKGFEFSCGDGVDLHQYVINNARSYLSKGMANPHHPYLEFKIVSTGETLIGTFEKHTIKKEYKKEGYRIIDDKIYKDGEKINDGVDELKLKICKKKICEYTNHIYRVCDNIDELKYKLDQQVCMKSGGKVVDGDIKIVGDDLIEISSYMINKSREQCKMGKAWISCRNCSPSICPLLVSGMEKTHMHHSIFVQEPFTKIDIILYP
jgi:hypothetical protein